MEQGAQEQVVVRRRDLRRQEEAERRRSRRTFRRSEAVSAAPAPVSSQVVAQGIAFRGSDGSAVRRLRRNRALVGSALGTVTVAGASAAAVLLSGAPANGEVQTAEQAEESVYTPVGAESVDTGAAPEEGVQAVGRAAVGEAPTAEGESAQAAGREIKKTVLPGCSGQAPTSEAQNGQLPDEWLCSVGIGDHKLRSDAAVAFAKMNAAYKAETGEDMALTDTYRSLESQVSVASRKPGLAARPGTSLHGWGLAIDFGAGAPSASGQLYNWLVENAGEYGWENPDWAKSSKYEPWHWEYVPGRQSVRGS